MMLANPYVFFAAETATVESEGHPETTSLRQFQKSALARAVQEETMQGKREVDGRNTNNGMAAANVSSSSCRSSTGIINK